MTISISRWIRWRPSLSVRALMALVFVAPWAVVVAAALNSAFTYQGQLQQGGIPTTATCDFQFGLFSVASGAGQLGSTQPLNNVAVTNGLFTVQLNGGGEFGANAFDGNNRFLELAVRCPAGSGSFTTLTPRQPVNAEPYALFAGAVADNAVGSASIADGAVATADLAINAVTGAKIADTSVAPADVSFNFAGSSSQGGPATSLSLPLNQAVASATSAFRVSNSGGKAIEGISSAANDIGVWGIATNSGGIGVKGGGTLFGVLGEGALVGMAGIALSGGLGVSGSIMSGSGTGVSGTGSGDTGIGVAGRNDANIGVKGTGLRGVEGHGDYGVSGYSSNIGVFAQNNSSGATAYLATNCCAADLFGNVVVHGTLNVTGSKNFRIDHPLDPANKYLRHAAVESPEMKNIYDGIVVLDELGEAWVDLPAWFEALNQDFRYQLTAIGAAAPGLFIAENVGGNRFKIAGGHPGLEVSWQITGNRHDAYAIAHPLEVEAAKSPAAGAGGAQ